MTAAPAVANARFKSPDVLYAETYEARQFDAVYFGMMIFACLIALMGLLLNSPAVIIGAMLISPLMGPILACGLALTTAEWSLGKKAARNVLLSVAEVVLIAILATRMSPLRELTPEILARSNPNLMDLFIAFFSGLAGTVALASRKTAFTVLPGVAIATAVMPPLVTVGYGISTRQTAIASGAFMLFFTNFTAIVLSASLVFLLIGFRPQVERAGETHHLLIRWRIAIAAAVLAVISIPLMRTLIRASQQAGIRGQVQQELQRSLREHGGRQLEAVGVRLVKDGVDVTASVHTAQYIDAGEVDGLRAMLERRIGRHVHLQIQQLQLAQKAPSTEQVIRDFLAAGLVKPVPGEKPVSPASEIGSLQDKLENSLGPLVGAAGVKLHITSIGKGADGTVSIIASAEAPHLTSDDMWKVAATALAADVSAPVAIHATVVGSGMGLNIPYRGSGERPAAAELRRVRQFVASLPKGVPVVLVASAGLDPALATRRIAHLRRFVTRNIVDLKVAAPADGNGVAIVPVRTVNATSEQTPVGEEPATAPAPRPTATPPNADGTRPQAAEKAASSAR